MNVRSIDVNDHASEIIYTIRIQMKGLEASRKKGMGRASLYPAGPFTLKDAVSFHEL
jgi:hypothetical protein